MSNTYEYYEQNLKHLWHYEYKIDDLTRDISFYAIGVGMASTIGLIHALMEQIKAMDATILEINTERLKLRGEIE